MAYANNFDDYLKNSVIDLSNVESNRTPEKKKERVDSYIVFDIF
jgi:hypothetical protein